MMLRLWPPIALAAMFVLGWAVGKGSTPLDDWFLAYGRSPARYLLFFTDARVLAVLVAGTLLVAIYQRRWRFAVVAVMSAAAALGLVRLLKPLFDRQSEGTLGTLAYPSGHTATMVVVLGILVLVARAALWAVLVAVVWCLLGIVGQAVGYHYFTDTIGALLLGSAIVCLAALTSGRTPHRT
jgi:membrane-associated phospholipid phosphatase